MGQLLVAWPRNIDRDELPHIPGPCIAPPRPWAPCSSNIPGGQAPYLPLLVIATRTD